MPFLSPCCHSVLSFWTYSTTRVAGFSVFRPYPVLVVSARKSSLCSTSSSVVIQHGNGKVLQTACFLDEYLEIFKDSSVTPMTHAERAVLGSSFAIVKYFW